MITAITNVRVFDGERVLDARTVVLDGPTIQAVGEQVPVGVCTVDGRGATLLPGLIDAHVHTSVAGLRDALRFGVTTELEMMGHWSAEERADVAGRDDLADLRSAGLGVCAPDGHPNELFGDGPPPGVDLDPNDLGPPEMPSVSTPADAVTVVAGLASNGSDYIKIMIEDGHVLGAPGLPMLSTEAVTAAVDEAHRHGKLAVAHVLTVAATEQALACGMDGLAHLFLDRPHTAEVVSRIAESGAFVTPCLVLNASIMGRTGAALADDARVSSRLDQEWLATLRGSFDTYPQGRFDDVLATVRALHRAGVDILVGTDVSVPLPQLGGLAHGASVHHELRLLVAAGLSPTQALRAATALPAARFGLTDRGRIAAGARADLLLVEGDPTTDIEDTLSIKAVWRRGTRLEEAAA